MVGVLQSFTFRADRVFFTVRASNLTACGTTGTSCTSMLRQTSLVSQANLENTKLVWAQPVRSLTT